MASKGTGRGRGKGNGINGDPKTASNRYAASKTRDEFTKMSEEEEALKDLVRKGHKCYRIGFGALGYAKKAFDAIHRVARCIDVPGINREWKRENGDEALFQVVHKESAAILDEKANFEDPLTRDKFNIQWVRLAGTFGDHAGCTRR